MWFFPVARATPDAEALAAAWSRDEAAIRAASDVPPRLGEADFPALATGVAVAHRFDTDAGAFVTGAVWVAAPLPMAWITGQDGQDRPVGATMAQEWVPGGSSGRRSVWMLLDLPRPLSDRQWISDFRNSGPLYAATEGRVWQRTWTLGAPAVAPNPDPDAVWVDENRGAWTMVEVDGGTLCVLTVRTVIGGAVPEAIANAWAASTLKKSLGTFATMAAGTSDHYREGHVEVERPDGSVIPPVR